MAGKYEKFWPMRVGGPYDEGEEAFKCTECGAVTYGDNGWNGEPNTHRCSAKCRDSEGDWSPGKVSDTYRRNYDAMYPDALGAGIGM